MIDVLSALSMVHDLRNLLLYTSVGLVRQQIGQLYVNDDSSERNFSDDINSRYAIFARN